jgi:nucleotide-binding universal stress UspA family protein
MSQSDKTRPNILVGVDYSEISTLVVEEAVAFAQRYRPCNLHFLHVGHFGSDDEAAREGRRVELLAWLAARLPQTEEELDRVSVIAHEAGGDPSRVIVQMAKELAAGLVVLGTHGRQGLDRVMMGSVAEAVSRHCGCSVLVVRRGLHGQFAELEPVCGVCVEARLKSQGNVLWCHDHAARNDRRYAHHRIGQWVRDSFGG